MRNRRRERNRERGSITRLHPKSKHPVFSSMVLVIFNQARLSNDDHLGLNTNDEPSQRDRGCESVNTDPCSNG